MKRVSPGEPLRISAMDWNRIAELVDSDGMSQARKPYQGSNSPCIVLGCNQTGSRIEMGMTLVLEGLRITPAENEEDFLSGSVYDLVYSGNGILGVALQPIEPGEIGPVVISGHVPVLVSVSDSSHLYANPGGNGYLVSAEDGAVRLSYTNQSTGLVWCNAVLGAGGGGVIEVPEEYAGPFKLSSATCPDINASIIEGATVSVSSGEVYNTNRWRSNALFWQWAGGTVSIPAIDTTVQGGFGQDYIYVPWDISYADIEQAGETKEQYLSQEFDTVVGEVFLRMSAAGMSLECTSMYGTATYRNASSLPYIVAVIGQVKVVTGWVDDPANQFVRGVRKRLYVNQFWKYGETLNGVFVVGNQGSVTYPVSTALYPTAPGLYIDLYDGIFGCWPISDTEVLVKGGSLKRTFQGTTHFDGVLQDRTIDCATELSTTYAYISIFPSNKSLSAEVSQSSLSCALATLAYLDWDATNSRISRFRYQTGGNGAFIGGTGLRSGYVISWTATLLSVEAATFLLEPHDASNLVLYWRADSTNHADLISADGGVSGATQGAVFWTNDRGILWKGGSQNAIEGLTTRISYWSHSTGLTGYSVGNVLLGQSAPEAWSSRWKLSWLSDGTLKVTGGRLDCGWTTVDVAADTLAAPSSSEHVWLEVTYSGATSMSVGTITAAFQHGTSLPSSTAATVVLSIGRIGVSSGRVVAENYDTVFPLSYEVSSRVPLAVLYSRAV